MTKFSRLSRKQEKKSIRSALIFGLLTVVLAIGVILLGIPALIKMAVFLGDLKSSSIPIETRDTIPPSAPIFTTSLEATNSSDINIAGYGEPGSTIILFLNEQEAEQIVADNEGLFRTDINLSQGSNEIYSYSQDESGNKSAKSATLSITYSNKAPKLEIASPSGEQSSTDKDKITIVGATDPQINITINDHLVIVDNNGNFEYPVNLTNGENQINVVASDKAGNKTEKLLTVNFVE